MGPEPGRPPPGIKPTAAAPLNICVRSSLGAAAAPPGGSTYPLGLPTFTCRPHRSTLSSCMPAVANSSVRHSTKPKRPASRRNLNPKSMALMSQTYECAATTVLARKCLLSRLQLSVTTCRCRSLTCVLDQICANCPGCVHDAKRVVTPDGSKAALMTGGLATGSGTRCARAPLNKSRSMVSTTTPMVKLPT